MASWIRAHYKCVKCKATDSSLFLEGSNILPLINCYSCGPQKGADSMQLVKQDAPFESCGARVETELPLSPPAEHATRDDLETL